MINRANVLSISLVIALCFVAGCIPSIDVPWFMEASGVDQFKRENKKDIVARPVSVAVTSEDARRAKPSIGKWISWIPFAPYASDRHSGDPMPAFTCLDYRDVVPLLIAKDIRRSQIAQHSIVIDDKNKDALKDYELRLHLIIKDCSLTDTRYTYGLSIVGMGLWVLGAPQGSETIVIDIEWRLELSRDSSVIGQGAVRSQTKVYEGLYYLCAKGRGVFRGQSLNEEIHNAAFNSFSAELLMQINNAMESKGNEFWQGISFRSKQ